MAPVKSAAARSQAIWVSKLGNSYPAAQVRAQRDAAAEEIERLRSLESKGNDVCADCGSEDNSWASLKHGVFLCAVCADVHRRTFTREFLKCCDGPCVWGPDELAKLRARGNRAADGPVGGKKLSPQSSCSERQQYVYQKYTAAALEVELAPVSAWGHRKEAAANVERKVAAVVPEAVKPEQVRRSLRFAMRSAADCLLSQLPWRRGCWSL